MPIARPTPHLPWTPDPARGALRIVLGDRSIPVRQIWQGGLAVDSGCGRLPGMVHLHEGDTHVATGLICSDMVENGLHKFHFKRLTPAFDTPPRPDFAQADDPRGTGFKGPEWMRSAL